MEEIECVLCKTYSHSVLSVIAILLPLPSVCLWHVAHASARAFLYKKSPPTRHGVVLFDLLSPLSPLAFSQTLALPGLGRR